MELPHPVQSELWHLQAYLCLGVDSSVRIVLLLTSCFPGCNTSAMLTALICTHLSALPVPTINKEQAALCLTLCIAGSSAVNA